MARPSLLLLIPASIPIAALLGCAGVTAPSPGEVWGGEHLGLTIGAIESVLEYDCASGTIDGPIAPDADGRFSATGSHTPGQGGPVRQGERPTPLAARYTGRLRGDEMTLVVVLPATDDTVGRFALRRGRAPTIYRCL